MQRVVRHQRNVFKGSEGRDRTYTYGISFQGLITFISDECEPELMCLFTANDYDGEVIICDEGDLCWVSKDKILELPTWEGDAVFLKLLLSDEQRFLQ